MAALTQARSIAGCRAFGGLRTQRVKVANGAFATMSSKLSYMVEVDVGEDEPEDIAVRRFMKKVMDSRLIEQLRARRYSETPRDEFKRRTRERIERIKAKEVLATYEEEHGPETDVKPFDEFFPNENNPMDPNGGFLSADMGLYEESGGFMQDGAQGVWGGYLTPNGSSSFQGGYMQGGYMNAPAQGGYTYQAPTGEVPPAQQAPQ